MDTRHRSDQHLRIVPQMVIQPSVPIALVLRKAPSESEVISRLTLFAGPIVVQDLLKSESKKKGTIYVVGDSLESSILVGPGAVMMKNPEGARVNNMHLFVGRNVMTSDCIGFIAATEGAAKLIETEFPELVAIPAEAHKRIDSALTNNGFRAIVFRKAQLL